MARYNCLSAGMYAYINLKRSDMTFFFTYLQQFLLMTCMFSFVQCADLLEIRKKYFEEKSLYSLFQNAIPEVIFDFLLEIGVLYKICVCLGNVCVKCF